MGRTKKKKEEERKAYFNMRLLTAAGVVQTTAFSFLALFNLCNKSDKVS